MKAKYDLSGHSGIGLMRIFALMMLLNVGLVTRAAEDYPEIEYNRYSYHNWQPETEISPSGAIYTQFNFCYYNDSGYDSWSEYVEIYVDEEYVGKFTNFCGDGNNRTFFMYESAEITSAKNGKVKACTDAFAQSGDDYWVRIKVYIQNIGYNRSHQIKVKTSWFANRDYWLTQYMSYNTSSTWTYMPQKGTVSSAGRNKARWSNTSAPYWYTQYVAIMKQDYSIDKWIEPNDDNSVFHKMVVSANRSDQCQSFNCDFDVESNYTPSTFYPRYYFTSNNSDFSQVRMYDYCSSFNTTYFYRPKNVRYSFDQWKKAVTLTWDVESYDNKASSDGRWMIVREKDGMKSVVGTTSDFYDRTFTDTSSSIQYGQDYTYRVYFLPFSWGDATTSNCADDLMASTTASTPCTYDITLQAEGQENSILLSWDAQSIEQDGDYQYTIYRATGDGAFESIKKLNVDNRLNTHYEFIDENIPDASASYKYYVSIKVMNTQFDSDSQVASVSGFSRATEITASKGGYDNTVKISWKAQQLGTTTTYYELSRRVLNSLASWEQIYTTSGTADSYTFNDQTLVSGIYYEYRLLSYSLDSSNKRYGESEVSTNGFCSLTGTISGSINFGSGTAVAGVRVNLELAPTGNNPDVAQFHSLRCGGAFGGIRWDVDSVQARNKLKGKKWTTQFYINPATVILSPVIFDATGVRVSLGNYSETDNTFGILLNGIAVADMRIKADQFTHLTIAYTGGSTFTIYAIDREGTLTEATATASGYSGFTEGATHIYFGSSSAPTVNNGFVGHIDDIRFFAGRAVPRDEVLNDYDHTLAGTESGLLAYWPLDEGIPNQRDAYDYSRTNGAPNENHGMILPNSSVDGIVPDASQLSIYALTDDTGNYIIRGIHYSGSGTNYIVRPQLGIHEFSPNTMTRFISGNSNVYSGSSFTDVSSFPVSGVIYYQGTNYPVEECLIKVDGVVASRDGEMIKTGKDGRFTVDVPIGKHFISVERSGHTFVLEGRFPAADRYDFNSEMSGLTFYDNTLVMVTGRIDGGAVEQAKPMGFGSSVNNIGVAEIVLEADYMMNARQETVGSAVIWQSALAPRAFDDGNNRIAATITGGYGSTDEAKRITITTDSRTGEFCAMLPPVLYTVKSVRVLSNPDVDFGEFASTINASKATIVYTDSLRNENSGTYDYFKYNAKFNLAYRSTPQLEVSDPDADEGALGEKEYIFHNDDGTNETVSLYTVNEAGNVNYKYQYPVYLQLNQYKLKLQGYELYENHDQGAAVPQQRVPLQRVGISISNEFSIRNMFREEDGSLAPVPTEGFSLDSIGCGTYVFTIGAPSLLESENFSRTLAISYSINGNRYSYPDIRGIVFGNIPTGSNFVTAGPDMVAMILRDPPGSGSSATWSDGYSITQSYEYTGSNIQSQELELSHKFGVKLGTAIGAPGFLTITEATETATTSNDLTVTETVNHYEAWTSTTSTVQNISTSDDPAFDGPDADVFIGRSTNIIIGRARDVGLHRGSDGQLHLDMKEIVSIGTKFDTEFRYTQHFVQNTLIPNFITTRNSLILPKGTEVVNNGMYYKYVSLVDDDDPNFGLEGTYTTIYPKGQMALPERDRFVVDSVNWCNDQIIRWRNVLMENERVKVTAIENRPQYLLNNFSFDAGSIINYDQEKSESSGTGTGTEVEVDEKFTVAFCIDKIGNGLDSKITIGYTRHNDKMRKEETTNTSSLSFTLAEQQTSDALTVDVFNAPDEFGYIFVTRGGQTSGNWEPRRVTQYYRPGTEIMAQTQRVVVPRIYIDNPIVENVPVGEPAMFNVIYANESETRGTAGFTMGMDNFSNPHGAEVLMGGGTLNQGIDDVISYGTPVKQTVIINQTDYDALDYRIALILFDATQASPTGTYPANADTAYIEAHFVPASSRAVLSTSTPYINENVGDSRASFTIKDYNLNLRNFRTVALRHKGINDQEWTIDNVWNTLANCATPEDSLAALTEPQIKYDIDMSDPRHWPEQTYIFQVTTMSVFGENKEYFYGDEIQVIKDTTAPIVVGTPSPSNGMLYNDSEISVSFNEDIRGELLTADENILVIGRLNNATLTHDVAAAFAGGAGASSEAKMQIKGSAMSLNMWLLHKGGAASLYSQGSLNIAIDEYGHLVVGSAEQSVTSSDTLPADQWIFLSVIIEYVNGTPHVTADAAYDATTLHLIDLEPLRSEISTAGIIEIGRQLQGEIHEVAVWDYARPFSVAVTERSKPKSQYTSHLVAYWPMNEGYGSVLYDKVAARNLAMLPGTTWAIADDNYSLALESAQVAALNLSECATQSDDDYLLQLWFRAEDVAPSGANILSYNDNSTALTISGSDGHLALVNGDAETLISSADLRDGQWHQFSMMVHKSTNANANIYLDAKSVAVVSSSRVANLADELHLGGGFRGNVDELRILHDYYSADVITANIYQRSDSLNASVMGLKAYFPFEKTILDQYGQEQTVSTLANQGAAPMGSIFTLQGDDLSCTDAQAPAIRPVASVQNVDFDFYTTERTIYVTLKEKPATIQGCKLYVTVRDVKDKAGNNIDQVTWSFTVDDNSLFWLEPSVSNLFSEYSTDDERRFKATIFNGGADDEVWTLEGIPAWLDVDINSGTLQPASYTELNFTVSEALPTGINEGNIYLIDSNGISHSLPYSFTKLVNRPIWEVDTDKYPNTMNIIGQVVVDGVIQENPYSQIAAFDSADNCIGTAMPTHFSRYGTSYFMLTIYGNQASSEPLRFRYYDANDGTISPSFKMTVAGIEQAPSFVPNAVLGAIGEPFIWATDENIEQNTDIRSGWQWISFYADPVDPSIASIFDIVDYNGEPCISEVVQNDAYARLEADGTWSGELTTVQIGLMYKVNSTGYSRLSLIGPAAAALRRPITIKPMWNWLGANVSSQMMLATALADMSPEEGDVIKNRTKMAIFTDGGWIGDLAAITPGEGYFYRSNAADTKEFTYPSSATQVQGAPALKAPELAAGAFGSYNTALYDGTMTVTATVMCDGHRLAGCELAAFDDTDSLCGDKYSHDEDDRHLIYMVVHADHAQTITFRLALTDADGNVSIYNLTETLNFEDGAALGSSFAPVVFDITNLGISTVYGDTEHRGVYKTLDEYNQVIIHRGSDTFTPAGRRAN